jgi:hypothetical protein
MTEELGTPHTILAAQAAADAVTDLLQHHRNGELGRFGGEVVARLMKEEICELNQLRAAIRKWEGRA